VNLPIFTAGHRLAGKNVAGGGNQFLYLSLQFLKSKGFDDVSIAARVHASFKIGIAK
jgi:hypothetical protein